uniref:EIF2A domain-containing protein n=1 Tax=Macrostomum lignano TaxID=282301 RepID=A0A1I8IC15_9PLAT
MFEVDTGKMKRSFLHEQAAKWPVFKWSHKGEFFARVQTGKALQVFETPSFSLLDKKSISVQDGNYLCVRVNRYTKKKLDADNTPKYINIYTNFEVFRMREKNIPVEKIEVTDAVSCFTWEPHGSKFAMVQGIASKGLSVVFYQVNAHDIEKVKVLEKRNVNTISWSPIGQHVVLAGLRSANGGLEFIDTSDMKTTANQEHFGATDIEWDPTGRYVVTTVSFWHSRVLFARHFAVQAEQVGANLSVRLATEAATLLSDEQIKNIKKNMKTYSRRFEKEDLQSSTRASKELLEKRARLNTEYEKWRAKLLEKFRGEKQKRLELRGVDTDELDSNAQDFVEETLEFPIKVERIRIDKLPQVAE